MHRYDVVTLHHQRSAEAADLEDGENATLIETDGNVTTTAETEMWDDGEKITMVNEIEYNDGGRKLQKPLRGDAANFLLE